MIGLICISNYVSSQTYLYQTKKYIVAEFSECMISKYTDTTLSLNCKNRTPNVASYYFNNDGVCVFYMWWLNYNDTQSLIYKLEEEGFVRKTLLEQGLGYYHKESETEYTHVDIKSSEIDGLYSCSFYKLIF